MPGVYPIMALDHYVQLTGDHDDHIVIHWLCVVDLHYMQW